MTPKRARFVDEYLKDLNATQAAIRAGYSAKTAEQSGSRMLGFVDVKAAIEEKRAKLTQQAEVTVGQVLRELRALGFSDMRDYLKFGDDGEVRIDFDNMPKEASRAIQEITQEEYTDGQGDDARPIRRTKFKLHPKTPALELIAKYLGMLVERHEISLGDPMDFMEGMAEFAKATRRRRVENQAGSA